MAAIGTPAADSDAMKNRRRTTTKAKRPIAPKVSGRRKPSSTNADAKTALFKRERDEALEQQKATAEVLRIISSSPGDVKPVFDAILANATRLCEARFATLWLAETDGLRAVAVHNAPPAFAEARLQNVVPPGQNTAVSRVITSKEVEQVEDIATDPAYRQRDPLRVALVELVGARTLVVVPMLKDDELVGTINIYRQEVRRFTDKQIELLKNFAAQAVIAIENTRLLNELRESLEQQTATADVLRVISSSPGELEPVFQAMLGNATRICEAKFGVLYLYDGQHFTLATHIGAGSKLVELMKRGPISPHPDTILGRILALKDVVEIEDTRKERLYLERHPLFVAGVEQDGALSLLGVPMLREQQLTKRRIAEPCRIRQHGSWGVARADTCASTRT